VLENVVQKTVVAVQQAHAEAFFQGVHGMRDGGRFAVQTGGGAAEAAGFGNSNKGGEFGVVVGAHWWLSCMMVCDAG